MVGAPGVHEDVVVEFVDTGSYGHFHAPVVVFAEIEPIAETDAAAYGGGAAVVVLIAVFAVFGVVVVCQAEVGVKEEA